MKPKWVYKIFSSAQASFEFDLVKYQVKGFQIACVVTEENTSLYFLKKRLDSVDEVAKLGDMKYLIPTLLEGDDLEQETVLDAIRKLLTWPETEAFLTAWKNFRAILNVDKHYAESQYSPGESYLDYVKVTLTQNGVMKAVCISEGLEIKDPDFKDTDIENLDAQTFHTFKVYVPADFLYIVHQDHTFSTFVFDLAVKIVKEDEKGQLGISGDSQASKHADFGSHADMLSIFGGDPYALANFYGDDPSDVEDNRDDNDY